MVVINFKQVAMTLTPCLKKSLGMCLVELCDES